MAEISHLLYCFYKPLHHPKPSGKVCYQTFQPWLGFFQIKAALTFQSTLGLPGRFEFKFQPQHCLR